MENDGFWCYKVYVRKTCGRSESFFGLLLGAVSARASCYIRVAEGAPKLELLQPRRRRRRLKPSFPLERAPCAKGQGLSARAPCLN